MYADLIFMILSYFKNNITFIICICVVCVHLGADVLMCVCLPPPFLRESLSLNTTSGFLCLGALLLPQCWDYRCVLLYSSFEVGTGEFYLGPYTCAASTLPTLHKLLNSLCLCKHRILCISLQSAEIMGVLTQLPSFLLLNIFLCIVYLLKLC